MGNTAKMSSRGCTPRPITNHLISIMSIGLSSMHLSLVERYLPSWHAWELQVTLKGRAKRCEEEASVQKKWQESSIQEEAQELKGLGMKRGWARFELQTHYL